MQNIRDIRDTKKLLPTIGSMHNLNEWVDNFLGYTGQL